MLCHYYNCHTLPLNALDFGNNCTLSVPNLPIASVLASEPKGDILSNSVEKSLLLSITFAVQSAITTKYRVRETKSSYCSRYRVSVLSDGFVSHVSNIQPCHANVKRQNL